MRALKRNYVPGREIMLLKIMRFFTLVFVALSMGMAFCHALQLPAKMQYDGSQYVMLQNSLYVAFGPPNIGAFIEFAAILTPIALTFLVRKRRPAFQLTLAATICLLVSFPVVFFLFTEPANTVFRQATPTSVPANWVELRNQWEYSHAARFLLDLVGFSALLSSILAEKTQKGERDRLTETAYLSHR